jgi:hypothetical protein
MNACCNSLNDELVLFFRKFQVLLVEVKIELILVLFKQLIEARKVKCRVSPHFNLFVVNHLFEKLHESVPMLEMKP